MHPPSRDVTALLKDIGQGDGSAVESLLPMVYEELRSLAGSIFAREHPQHTLQPTALLHEAWIKMAGGLDGIDDRRHFFIVAGMAMRQVIADHARGKLTQRRGGPNRRVELTESVSVESMGGEFDLIDLDDCLNRLAKCNQRHAKVAELRLFSGLSIRETAEYLKVSTRLVDSDWAMAKAWLRHNLQQVR